MEQKKRGKKVSERDANVLAVSCVFRTLSRPGGFDVKPKTRTGNDSTASDQSSKNLGQNKEEKKECRPRKA